MNNNTQSTKLHILQWNINGLQKNMPLLGLAIAEQRFDIIILQETLLKSHTSLSSYTAFHKFYTAGSNRGISIFVKSDIYAESITTILPCGPEIEYQGISITLQNMHLQIFNIYRPPRDSAKLKLDHIFAAVSNAPSVLCGDFNAHHIIWNDPTSNSANRTCRTGQHLSNLLHSFPQVALLNSKTHSF